MWRPVLPAFVNDPNAWLKDVKPFLIRERDAVPLEGAAHAHQPGVREGLRRGEVARLGDEHDPDRRPDPRRPLLGREPAGHVDPCLPHAVGPAGRVAGGQRAPVRDGLHDRRRRADHASGTTRRTASFWRPITAIREADTDGNPRRRRTRLAAADRDPAVHEHPSGHAGLSGSIVATLQDFFGTDGIGWTDTTNGGLTRSFTRFSQAIDEIVDARVWSGIHFRSADEQGARSA